MRAVSILAVVVVVLLTAAMLFRPGWDRPPIETDQTGFRGLGMVEVTNPRKQRDLVAANQVPEPIPEIPTEGAPLASEVYENVPLLGHLPDPQFIRLMTAITEWVSPEEGCAYCHNLENLASDEPYAKRVSSRMIQMTWHVNQDWTEHVGDTGVTCYTCHRGQPVPQAVWYSGSPMAEAGGLSRGRAGQNIAGIGATSLPTDPFTPLLEESGVIRVEPRTALPTDYEMSIQQTEASYALMIHMSNSLGVNCTYCHNSRSFGSWGQATPQRANAWHGIYMTRAINQEYIVPLTPILPDYRLGPEGDAPKANCTTCHQGAALPLLGVSMLPDYPSLRAPGDATGPDVAGTLPAGHPVVAEHP